MGLEHGANLKIQNLADVLKWGWGFHRKNTRNNPGLVESAAAKGTRMRQPRAIIKMNNRDNRGRR